VDIDLHDLPRVALHLHVMHRADLHGAPVLTRRPLDHRRGVTAAVADEVHHLNAMKGPPFAIRIRMAAAVETET
jgi:hypothetical protein